MNKNTKTPPNEPTTMDDWDAPQDESLETGAPEEADPEEDTDDGVEEEEPEADARGPRPRFREAIRAKCFDCCGDMLDGRIDCQVVTCPLYYWQPYRKLQPNLAWRTDGSHLQKNRAALRERLKTTRQGGGEENGNA